ncbi:MAG: N-acetyl-alpha-D-glucosaminyl L-malate synthase BshA [Bacteroidetes bacterium RIFCSPLOWO2_02_FULL_36_8]|nr:MAG: N-acetyl-alpha-D-glucosaminyl L-malate synthase BshA [Bacteroidetes bacterium RIFCSPLOWO2_02_FULL_36_8]OFY71153.1 MAG: N-acetyl-alpha-D-glucosaminyl L-malate synthase BshA [Bacteroidetes bacterium RIFCSPLOWO2_12_FULL_37_12]
MKIGIVCYPTYGGSGVVATELGMALAAKGHQVHFISYAQPFRLDTINENIFYHEVNFNSYPLFEYPPYELALASKLVDIVKFEKLQLLHVHYAIPHASAAFLAKEILKTYQIHIPVITTLHGTDITLVGKDATYEPVVTFSINQSDGVTAVSQFLKDDTYRHFNIKKKIEVIPNFINLQRFQRLKKEHFRKALAPHDEKIIVHTSNFRPVKRIEDVLKIFQKLRNHVTAKLILIGDGPDRKHAEDLCRQMNYCADIRFIGKVDAVEEILSISDLFLMPSESESFGLAALEAMACEVPLITTNAGGLPELNVDGITGFNSPVGDTEKMANDALFILEDNHLPGFKKRAWERAKEFDVAKILPLYENYYKKIVGGDS